MKLWTIIICVSLVLILYLGIRLRFVRYENKMTNAYMDMMEEMNQFITNRVEMTRRFRHDLKNHIMTIDLLMQQEKEDGLNLDSIDRAKLISCYEAAKATRFCKDEYVDTIVGMKADFCRDENIPIEVDIEDTVFPEVDTLTMATIVYNLLDNAIEASQDIEDATDRMIRFKMEHVPEGIDIRCENRTKKGRVIDFKSRKADSVSHGMGMKIVKSAIEKYEGMQTIEVDRKNGLVDIRIRLKVENEFKRLA